MNICKFLQSKYKKDDGSHEVVQELGRSTVAQSVERPSKVPVWCNTEWLGFETLRGFGGRKKSQPHHLATVLGYLYISTRFRKVAKQVVQKLGGKTFIFFPLIVCPGN